MEIGDAIREWSVTGYLGKGLCGIVVSGQKKDGSQAAIKVVDLEKLNKTFRDYGTTPKELLDNLHQEIKILSHLKHPNIVHFVDSFSAPQRIFICMELICGKDLVSMVPLNGLAEQQAKDFFFQICTAVAYCHSRQIIHGDLKPENILVRQEDKKAKLIDFGFAHLVTGQPISVMGGTLLYSPPCDDEMTYAFDDWAVGIILYAMVTCSLPFTERDLTSQNDLNLKIPPHVPQEVVAILASLLNPEPLARTSTGDVLMNAEWLESERKKGIPESLSQALSVPKEMKTPVRARRTASVTRRPSNEPLVRTTRKLGFNPFDFFRKKKERKDGDEMESLATKQGRKRSYASGELDLIKGLRSPPKEPRSPPREYRSPPKQAPRSPPKESRSPAKQLRSPKQAKSLSQFVPFKRTMSIQPDGIKKNKTVGEPPDQSPKSPPFKFTTPSLTTADGMLNRSPSHDETTTKRSKTPTSKNRGSDFLFSERGSSNRTCSGSSTKSSREGRETWFLPPNYGDDDDGREGDVVKFSDQSTENQMDYTSSSPFLSNASFSRPALTTIKVISLSLLKYCEDLSDLIRLRDRLPPAERKKIIPKLVDDMLLLHNDSVEDLMSSSDSTLSTAAYFHSLATPGFRGLYGKYFRKYPSCIHKLVSLKTKYPKFKLVVPVHTKLIRLLAAPLSYVSECLGYLPLLSLESDDSKTCETIRLLMTDLTMFQNECQKALCQAF